MAASIHFILQATIIVALSTSLVTANKNHGRALKRIRRQGIRQLVFAEQGMGL